MRHNSTLFRAALFFAVCTFFISFSVPAEDTPAGQRIFYSAHSFHIFIVERMEQLAKSAGISGHQTVGKQMIGGSRVIQHWELTGDKATAKPALSKGELDIFTMSPHLLMPDPGIDNFVALGLEHNPKLKFYIQASWVPFDMTPDMKKITDNSQREETDLDAWQKAGDIWRTNLEAQIDSLNTKYGKKALFIVPVGDAVLALRRLIKKGEFPGITSQAKLFRDPIGHGQGHIMALATYCNFAAIYKRSPVGLKLDERGVSDEQHAILQRIAWETVSKYERSGAK